MFDKVEGFLMKQKVLKNAGIGVSIKGNFFCKSPETVKIGNYVYIGPDARFWGSGNLSIGNNVIIGPNLTTITTNHNYKGSMIPYDSKPISKDIVIEDNVWIASNVSIIPGITIGEGAIVGMGTVVTKNVPPLAIVGSNKLQILGFRDEIEYGKLVETDSLYMKYKYESGLV